MWRGEGYAQPVFAVVFDNALPAYLLMDLTPQMVATLRAVADNMEAALAVPDAVPPEWAEGKQR